MWIKLKLRLVEEDESGKETGHFCCDRNVCFKKFDKEKVEKFMKAVQHVAQTIGELLGFSVYE